jgi:hypothetical protein
MNASAPVRTSTLAIASLVGGIAGWTLLPLLGSLVAIITGHMARAEIRRDPGLQGDGLAIAGLVMGWASVILSVLAVVAVVLFFGGLIGLLAVFGHH